MKPESRFGARLLGALQADRPRRVGLGRLPCAEFAARCAARQIDYQPPGAGEMPRR